MTQTIRVGMAKLGVAQSPDTIETQALGSCVGVVLYDSRVKVGGISHAMLPDINDAKVTSRDNLAKFVNTAIEELLKQMEKYNAGKSFITAKLAGGANMFPDILKGGGMHIGERNAEMARFMLRKLDIPLVAEETGGSFGRTIILDTETGILTVRTITHGLKEI